MTKLPSFIDLPIGAEFSFQPAGHGLIKISPTQYQRALTGKVFTVANPQLRAWQAN